MWTSFWYGPEGAASSPSQPRAAGDKKSGNHRRGGGRQKKEVATADRGGHVEAISEPAADYATILRGVIVGEKQSGKTCLIRRLRGDDPFQQERLENEGATKNTNRRSHRNLMALIPWKLPEAAVFRQKHSPPGSDDLVQLYISEGNSFCYSKKEISFQKQWMSVLQSQRGKEFDFIVWMIDPRMDNVLDFLREGLDALVPSTSDVHGDEESAEIIKHPLVQNLCILLNFRDSTKQSNGGQTSLVDQMQHVIEEALTSHKEYQAKQRQSRSADTTTPTILVYESCMKDCYGLQNLLSFINLPYLSHKEREFQRLAEHARKQHSQWKREMMVNKGVEYDEFIKQRLAQHVQTPKSSTERQRLEEEMEQLQRHLRQQSQLLQSDREIQGDTRASVKNQHGDEDGAASALATLQPGRSGRNGEQNVEPTALDDAVKRTLFAKSRPSSAGKKDLSNSRVPENDNLDSFFSDSEEDEQSKTNDSSDDSEGYDSDDGDFFIDVSGTRCAHRNAAASGHTKKSSTNRMHKNTPNIDRENEAVTVEEDSNHLDEKNDIKANSSREESANGVPSAEQSSSMKAMGENTVNDGKLELLNSPISDVGRVEDEVEGEYAGDSINDDTSKPNTWLQNADVVTSSEGACTVHAEATENNEVAAKYKRSKSPPSFHNQAIDDEQDDVSIDDATSTNAHGANDEMENSPNKISSEPYDEPAESGAEAISPNEGPQIREEEDDDDSSHQVAKSESNVDRIEERSGREDRKDREDIEDLEINTSNLDLPAMEKSYLVLDSDEEYICPTEGGNAGDRRSNPRAETVGRDAELTRDAARQLPQESLSVVPSLPDQTSVPAKSAAVSSAARAAIEAARAEAEKMIAQSQSDDKRSNEKREKKKSKKNKDEGEKKKKKKKKEKRKNEA
jgi:hypothetical protein